MKSSTIGFALAAALLCTACGGSIATSANSVAPSSTPTPTTGGAANATVTLTSITISGSVPAIGATVAFTATAHYSDGTSADVTSSASWSSSNPGVASVTPTGAVMLQAIGVCEITATYQGVSGTFAVVAAT